MTLLDIAKARLNNQHISSNTIQNAEELVHQMGALQAQDYRMVKWAMGIRLSGSTLEMIEAAIEKGNIIRTHLLRPTWHFVAAKDLRWILKLSAPRIKVAMRSRHTYLGLNDELICKSNAVIVNAIAKNGALTRDKLVSALEGEGFENRDNLASHLLLRAEIDGLICSGPTQGKNYTYALLNKLIPNKKSLTKEEAVAKLAHIYFKSHGPATLEDFTWWSGLTKTSAKKALQRIRDDFCCIEIESQQFWYATNTFFPKNSGPAYLLPSFDEFVISYKKRSRIIPHTEHRRKAISNNGIFRPVMVLNGEVVGIWNCSINKTSVSVELNFFETPSKKSRILVEIAADQFARFYEKKLEISFI